MEKELVLIFIKILISCCILAYAFLELSYFNQYVKWLEKDWKIKDYEGILSDVLGLFVIAIGIVGGTIFLIWWWLK